MRSNWPFPEKKLAIIGMVHLKPLPGSPLFESFHTVMDSALKDLKALEEGGVDGIMVENFNDMPFYKDDVPKETIASMTRVCTEIMKSTSLPVGINVLRNDSIASLAIAASCGASFIRANILTDAYVTDQGIIEGNAHRLLRYRRALNAESIAIWADVHSKHASPLSTRRLELAVIDTVERGLADAIIITGERTGSAPQPSDLRTAKKYSKVVVGSGVHPSNAKVLLKLADAAIIGTYFKMEGQVRNQVDAERVKKMMNLVKEMNQ
ncbi:MAG: BtpA/SgcQ family protein [Conexivisphaerales archaeon]